MENRELDGEEPKTPEETNEETNEPVESSVNVLDEGERMKKDLLYLRAEFDNYKKRMLRDQDQAIKFANEKLIHELVGKIDLLEMGLTHGKKLKEGNYAKAPEVMNFVNGMEMIAGELIQLLGRFGVEFIGKTGEKFDPAIHEAVSQVVTTPENVDKVLEVFQRGSLLQGRLLKPAKVVVGIAKK